MTHIKAIVFASGGSTGGGSGFEELVYATRLGVLGAEIVAVVSNYPSGGVQQRAARLGIPFVYFPSPWSEEGYGRIFQESGAEFALLSGWLKMARGLDARTTINIHPGPLPRFGGKGMHGHHVHEAVLKAFRKGEVTHSEVTMHFATEE